MDGASVEIGDVIPLFHTAVFGSMLETSTLLAKEYCSSTETPAGYEIVGVYTATSRNNYAGTPPLVKRIASGLREGCKGACLVLVDNAALSDETIVPLKVFAGEMFKPVKSFKVVNEKECGKQFTVLLKSKAQCNLVDVEEWLANTSLDWRNTHIDK